MFQDAILSLTSVETEAERIVLDILSENLSASFEPVTFRFIAKHSTSVFSKIGETLQNEELSKQTLSTLVKISKFFFKENNKTASNDLTSICSDNWTSISAMSKASKENLLFIVHLLKHLFLVTISSAIFYACFKNLDLITIFLFTKRSSFFCPVGV